MIRYRKGELKFYKSMDEKDLETYVTKFPENTEYVKKFLQTHKYNWVKKEWQRGRTL